MKARYITVLLLLLAGNSTADSSLKSLENISQELVTIREQIANLHNDINFEKDSYSDQIRSFSNQKTDLEVKSSRASLNIKELERELEKIKALNAEKFNAAEQVTPALKSSISTIRNTVTQSIPFKRVDRLNALKDIEHKLDASLISPNKAANQLWAFVEDELILGRSSGLYNDTLQINGEEKLVKVLRLGKVALFYKTNDEKYGMVSQRDGGWQQQAVINDAHIRQLEELFDSFNKNIRNGLFTTPNFLPQS